MVHSHNDTHTSFPELQIHKSTDTWKAYSVPQLEAKVKTKLQAQKLTTAALKEILSFPVGMNFFLIDLSAQEKKKKTKNLDSLSFLTHQKQVKH